MLPMRAEELKGRLDTRLGQAGLIAGAWSVVAGRRRRFYQLTAAGLQTLAGRLLLRGVPVAHGLRVEDLVVRRALGPEGDVDVGVGRLGHREVLEISAAESHPHHPGRQLVRRRDASVHRCTSWMGGARA